MFERISQNWTIWRFLRLGIAIFLIIEGITTQEWPLVAISGFLLYQVIFNVGCAGGSCAIPKDKLKQEEK